MFQLCGLVYVYYRMVKSLGYDEQFANVKCRVFDTTHIRLGLRYEKHTIGNWINRDSATVADIANCNIRLILCDNGYIIAYD